MSGGGADIQNRDIQLDTPESASNKPLELPKSPEQAKELIEQLKCSKEVAAVSKEAFAKKIGDIRKMSIDEIKKPENATILQTYAVLHMGATEEQIGGIDGKFGPKTLAIFRKCQADGVGGKEIKGVNQVELGKVAWGAKPAETTPTTAGAAAEAATTTAATPDTTVIGGQPNSPVDEIDQALITSGVNPAELSQEKTNEIWNSAIEEANQYAKEKGYDGVSSYAGEQFAKGGYDISKRNINTIQAQDIFLKKGNEEIEIGKILPEKTHLGNIKPSEEIVAQIKAMIDQESNKVVLTAKATKVE